MRNIPVAGWVRTSLRGGAFILGMALAAALFQPAARAQILFYNPGASVGQIEYSVQPIVTYTGVSPTWVQDGFTSGLTSPSVSLYDIMASPGGGLFNSFVPASPNFSGTGVIPLLGGFSWSQGAGGGFGGASMTSTPAGGTFSIADAEIPGQASVAIAAASADFTVGPGGIAANTFAGNTLSFNGTLDANAAVAASLYTYIADNTTHQLEAFVQILAAGGTAGGNPYVAWAGVSGVQNGWGNFTPPAGASAGALVIFGGGGTTFTGTVSSSQLLTAVGINAGDDIAITTVLTAIADPGATMNINYSDANNLTLVPEPGTLWLLLAGPATGWLLRKRRALA